MAKSPQTKSKNRVKAFGEVFTAEREVKAMCDLIPAETWERIDSTFLEPSCGNGNFLVEILSRKLNNCQNEREAFKAVASIVGIDIQADNCAESRARMKKVFLEKFPCANGNLLDLILTNNIICGDSLSVMEKWQRENEAEKGAN